MPLATLINIISTNAIKIEVSYSHTFRARLYHGHAPISSLPWVAPNPSNQMVLGDPQCFRLTAGKTLPFSHTDNHTLCFLHTWDHNYYN